MKLIVVLFVNLGLQSRSTDSIRKTYDSVLAHTGLAADGKPSTHDLLTKFAE